VVEHPRSGFPSDEDPGAGVPWLVAEHDAGIQPALGGPCQIDGGSPQHPNPLRVLSEPFCEAQAQRFLRSASSPKAYWSIEMRASASVDVRLTWSRLPSA
jgi:hypothetical protein